MLVHIGNLIDEATCFETVRQLRWPDGVTCPHCAARDIVKDGRDDARPQRQRYLCPTCHRRFDDLTDTIFAGQHQPRKTSILCLYVMGLNRSNQPIAEELDLNRGDVQEMTMQLRSGVVQRRPAVTLTGDVECDEVDVGAGHNGHPEAVVKKGGRADAAD